MSFQNFQAIIHRYSITHLSDVIDEIQLETKKKVILLTDEIIRIERGGIVNGKQIMGPMEKAIQAIGSCLSNKNFVSVFSTTEWIEFTTYSGTRGYTDIKLSNLPNILQISENFIDVINSGKIERNDIISIVASIGTIRGARAFKDYLIKEPSSKYTISDFKSEIVKDKQAKSIESPYNNYAMVANKLVSLEMVSKALQKQVIPMEDPFMKNASHIGAYIVSGKSCSSVEPYMPLVIMKNWVTCQPSSPTIQYLNQLLDVVFSRDGAEDWKNIWKYWNAFLFLENQEYVHQFYLFKSKRTSVGFVEIELNKDWISNGFSDKQIKVGSNLFDSFISYMDLIGD